MAARSSLSPTDDDQKSGYVFKVLVVGEKAAGKTAIVQRFVKNQFSKHYKATVGVDFALKIIRTNDGSIVRLQLWDIAGEERFGNMTRVYYKDAVGCIVVYDVTRPQTFLAVEKWKKDLDNKVQLPNGNSVPCILLANKCDLPKDSSMHSAEKMNKYCEENGFSTWFETSAKENINIEKSIQYLISEIMQYGDDVGPVRRVRPPDNGLNVSNSTPSSPSLSTSPTNGCCGGKS